MKEVIDIKQMIACAKREKAMRDYVYSKKVGNGSMTQSKANHEIACMQAIVDTLLKFELEGKDSLFNTELPTDGPLIIYQVRLNQSLENKLKLDTPPNLKLGYINGFLDSISNIQTASLNAPITKDGFPNMVFKVPVPYRLENIDKMGVIHISETHTGRQLNHFRYMRLEVRAINQKIAAFCEAYKRAFKEAYKVHPKDAKRWNGKEYKHVDAISELLDFYMQTTEYPTNGPKSIADYLKYYQDIQQLFKAAKSPKHTFPNSYDKKLMDKLASTDQEGYLAYIQHLKSMDYYRVVMPGGTTWRRES